jgi:hypothetical protein
LAFLGLVWRAYNAVTTWYGPGPLPKQNYTRIPNLVRLKLLVIKHRLRPQNVVTLTEIIRHLDSIPISERNESEIYFYAKGHFSRGERVRHRQSKALGIQIKPTFRPDVAFFFKRLKSRHGLKIFSNSPISEELLAMSLESKIEYTNEATRLPKPISNPNGLASNTFIVNEVGFRVRPFLFGFTPLTFFIRHPSLCLIALETTGSISTAKKILDEVSKMSSTFPNNLTLEKLKLIAESNSPIARGIDGTPAPNSWKTLEIVEAIWKDAGLSKFENSFKTYVKSFRKFTFQENVYVWRGGTILTEKGLLNTDYAQNPAFDFVAGRRDHIVGSHLTLKRARVKQGAVTNFAKIEEAVILASRCEDNWFHWIVETLPRILLLEKIRGDIPILISERVPVSGIEALRIVSTRNIIRVDDKTPIFVAKAFIPGQVIFHPDSLEFWDKQIFSIFDLDLLKQFRNLVLRRLNLAQIAPRDRIFLTRRSTHRNLICIRAAEKVLGQLFKFKIIDTANLSFREQVSSIANARSIIMVGGAGMANLLFAGSGSKIAVLYPRTAKGFDIQEKIGQVAESNTKTFFGPSLAALYLNRYSKIHANFFLTPVTWCRALNHVLRTRIQ